MSLNLSADVTLAGDSTSSGSAATTSSLRLLQSANDDSLSIASGNNASVTLDESASSAAALLLGDDDDGVVESELTVEDVVERIGQGRFQLKAMFVAGSTWVADGLELVVQSMLGSALACDWQITHAEQTLVFVVVFVFMFVGSSFFGILADRFGRRRVCLLAIFVTFVFGSASAFSPNIIVMYLTRGLCAFGIGGVHLAITMFAEFSPAKTRARGILLLELFWAVGTVLASVLALFLMPALGWRWLLGAASIPIAISFGLVWWLPESPRWLVRRNRMEEARAILVDAARLNRVALPPFRLVSKTDDRRVSERPARMYVARLFHPLLRRVTLTMWFVWPISVIAYYGIVLLTTTVFEAEARGVRCSSIDSTTSSALTESMTAALAASATTALNATTSALADASAYAPCVRLSKADYVSIMIESSFEVPGILVTIFLIDRLGRRRTAAIEYVVMGVCLLVMIPCLGRVVETGVLAIARAMIIGAFQIAYVYTPEVYPLDLRASALGTAMSVSRVGAMAAPFLAQYLAAESLTATFVTFAGLCFAAAIAWYSLPYETTGLRLFESIADLRSFLQSRSGQQPNETELQPTVAAAAAAAAVVDGEAGEAGEAGETSVRMSGTSVPRNRHVQLEDDNR
jgi:MFS family permease